MMTIENPVLGTLVENLIETSLRLQGSLCGEVPEGINGELLRCGELLNEIRQQAIVAEMVAPDHGNLKARLGYLKEILESNDALVREGAAYGQFALWTRSGGETNSSYTANGLPATGIEGGNILSMRG